MKGKNYWCRESGAAMVELAVLMVTFIPLVLIPLYLQDTIHYKFIAQERVFSSAWDFAFGNYEEKNISGHWGAIDNGNKEIFKNGKSGNKKDKSGQYSPWSDFRWPSQEVSCKEKEKGFASFTTPLARTFHNEHTKGGLVQCEGSIEVANLYVPSKIEMLGMKGNEQFFRNQGEFLEHNDGGKPMSFGIMVDPWTIHNPKDIKDRNGNDGFRKRVDTCWNKGISAVTWVAFSGSWAVFVAKAMQKKLLSPALMAFDNPPHPDDITSIHPVSKEYDRNAQFGRKKFWVSPYEDGDKNMFKQTYEARKQTYLGCENALDNGNC